jgi:hypothetical protein
MREPIESRPGQHQKGCADGQPLPVKHLQLLHKFRQHGSSHFGDDSGNDCLIGSLIVPI